MSNSGKKPRSQAEKKKSARRARMLTFAGATIVLATFIVKDGFKERIKDLDDSIIATENAIGIEESIDDVSTQQIATQLKLDAISNKLGAQRNGQVDLFRGGAVGRTCTARTRGKYRSWI